MNQDPKQDKELESSQDSIENLVTVQSVCGCKRTVPNKESLGHIGQGGSRKIQKSESAIGISEQDDSEDSQRTTLLRFNVRSVRESDWNKIKELSDSFDTVTEPLDKECQLNLLSSLYCHVRSNCGSPTGIYWRKPNFAHVTYTRRFTLSRTCPKDTNLDIQNRKQDQESESA